MSEVFKKCKVCGCMPDTPETKFMFREQADDYVREQNEKTNLANRS